MKQNYSKLRVFSPLPFINTDSSSSSHQRMPDLDSDAHIEVFNTEQIPMYTKFSLEHKSTEKLYLNNTKRLTSNERRTHSNHFCSTCISYQRTVDELKSRESSLSEKLIVTEKHLKQYDNLLQIKDSRLKQQECSLKGELENFEREKEKFALEKWKIEEERQELRKERQGLKSESTKIELDLEELARKAEEVQEMIEELEDKRAEIFEMERKSSGSELEKRRSLIISRETDIQRLMEEAQGYRAETSPSLNENFENYQKYLKQKQKKRMRKTEVQELANELSELKEKYEAERRQNFEELESRMMILTETEEKLLKEKNQLELLNFEVNEKMETVEQLKSALLMQQENLEKEKSLWTSRLLENSLDTPKRSKTRFTLKQKEPTCPNCKLLSTTTEELKEALQTAENSLNQSELQNQNLQNAMEILESKLKIIECSREEYENETYDLQQTISFIKSKKSLLKSKVQNLEKALNIDDGGAKQELARYTTQLANLTQENSQLKQENSSLCQRLQILTLKYEELESNQGHFQGSGEVEDLVAEMQQKLNKLKAKEKELEDFQSELVEERKVIKGAAEYIKNINDELSKQKIEIEEERGRNEHQKIRIIELERKQQDKGKVLIDKERELNLYRDKLVEREHLILLKEKGGGGDKGKGN